ncbi:cobalamin-binding protein [Undibacterium sp. 14-3-2]|uniref:cobalamin-binding protein n=1 Tax=Undibacterium sp. 14-3-2 TaxID=2800129 RepID=UPI001F3EBCF1|nr:cobalamin-binding protein [Undibacterium sp. 14-3-2]
MTSLRMLVSSICILPTLLVSASGVAAVSVKDDAQRTITLDKPAQRIISLAPHATELLFAAGAAKSIVAVSDYSDFPAAAKALPSVGNVFALDLEKLLALKPDLVVVWGTGSGKLLVNKLRDNHITVFESEPRDYEMVATSLERLAILAGTPAAGKAAAEQFRLRLANLQQQYQSARDKPISVFYQVNRKPLMTLNDTHMVSAAIRLCGGKNVFGALKEISPTVSVEALLAANPDAIITGGSNTDSLNEWRQFSVLTAAKKNHLYAVNGDWLNRAGPRILDGTEALCKQIAAAREK